MIRACAPLHPVRPNGTFIHGSYVEADADADAAVLAGVDAGVLAGVDAAGVDVSPRGGRESG